MNEPEIDPTSTGALYELAVDWARRGDALNALRYYAETLRLNSEEARARRGIGSCLRKLGRNGDAIEILCIAAEDLGHRGQWLPAIAACREALAIDPGAVEAHAMLGQLFDAFASSRRRRRYPRPPLPPQPVSASTKDSVVLLAEPDQVIARALAIGRARQECVRRVEPAPPFFAQLSRESFLTLVPKMELRNVDRGAQSVTHASLLIIVSGELIGDRITCFGPGSILGYRALIDEDTPPESARAERLTELFEIQRSELQQLARTDDSLAAEIAEFVKREMLRSLLASPMLENLQMEARVEIMGSFTSTIIPAGAHIIEQGARASGLYLIGSGQVQITREAGDATAEIAAMLGSGEVFGEIALLDHRRTTASAIAVEKSVLFHLDRARFVGLVARHADFRKYLVGLAQSRRVETHR